MNEALYANARQTVTGWTNDALYAQTKVEATDDAGRLLVSACWSEMLSRSEGRHYA
jgi:hypothetical protein